MKKLSAVPVGNRVIIKQQSLEKVTESGIVLQLENEAAEQAANIQGTVIAIGDAAWDQWPTPWAKVGDEVYFAKWAGKKVNDPASGETYLIMNDVDIVCRLEEVETDD